MGSVSAELMSSCSNSSKSISAKLASRFILKEMSSVMTRSSSTSPSNRLGDRKPPTGGAEGSLLAEREGRYGEEVVVVVDVGVDDIGGCC